MGFYDSGSAFSALDLIEYAETAAHYEYLNLSVGERSRVSAHTTSAK